MIDNEEGAPLEAPDKRGTAIMQGAKRKSTHGWMLLLGVLGVEVEGIEPSSY